MSSVSETVAIKAMDGLYMRAAAIAENIANSNSQTFHIRSVAFEDALRQAAEQGIDALSAFEPRMQAAPMAGSDVRLDLEMASASATSLRYSALSDVLNRQMQLNRLAIRGGQ